MIGRSDKEQGPKLVKRPPRKIIRIDNGFGLLRPLVINCSLLRAKSETVKAIEEIIKKGFTLLFQFLDYLLESLNDGFLINKSVDSIDDLTNKAAISKLEIKEFPP